MNLLVYSIEFAVLLLQSLARLWGFQNYQLIFI